MQDIVLKYFMDTIRNKCNLFVIRNLLDRNILKIIAGSKYFIFYSLLNLDYLLFPISISLPAVSSAMFIVIPPDIHETTAYKDIEATIKERVLVKIEITVMEKQNSTFTLAFIIGKIVENDGGVALLKIPASNLYAGIS